MIPEATTSIPDVSSFCSDVWTLLLLSLSMFAIAFMIAL